MSKKPEFFCQRCKRSLGQTYSALCRVCARNDKFHDSGGGSNNNNNNNNNNNSNSSSGFGHKLPTGGEPCALAFNGLTYGQESCITCDFSPEALDHLPHLSESRETREMAELLVRAINKAEATQDVYKPPKPGGKLLRGYMLGVLTIGGEVFVAISGASKKVPADLLRVIKATLPGAQFVDVQAAHLTAGGANVDNFWLGKMDETSPAAPFECAAPKLISIARSLGPSKSNPWCMTEIWCGPPDGYHMNGEAYVSCTNCLQILPMMLCLLESGLDDFNEKLNQKDSDGFSLHVHKKKVNRLRKAARGGRKAELDLPGTSNVVNGKEAKEEEEEEEEKEEKEEEQEEQEEQEENKTPLSTPDVTNDAESVVQPLIGSSTDVEEQQTNSKPRRRRRKKKANQNEGGPTQNVVTPSPSTSGVSTTALAVGAAALVALLFIAYLLLR